MEKRNCPECGKELKGRTDQKYCNDDCRNKYNRKLRVASRTSGHQHINTIIGIIKKNYALLKKAGITEPDVCILGGIRSVGIDPRFYTSVVQESYKTWYCCFDYGWYEDAGEGFQVRYFPEQAEIK